MDAFGVHCNDLLGVFCIMNCAIKDKSDLIIIDPGYCLKCDAVNEVLKHPLLLRVKRISDWTFWILVLTTIYFEFIGNDSRYFSFIEFYLYIIYSYIFSMLSDLPEL